MSESVQPVGESLSPVLSYGYQPRSRRWLRWIVAIILLLIGGLALARVSFTVSHLLAIRAGVRNVTAWMQQARSCQIPAGTLLYSEKSEDRFNLTADLQVRGGHVVRRYRFFTTPYPLLRTLGYHGDGVPVTYDYNTIYVHEQTWWAPGGGTQPVVMTVGFFGVDNGGKPQFATSAIATGADHVPFPMFGGTCAPAEVTRPLNNLRIYAGHADPSDGRRFTVPFDCDSGRGRFEFRTDDDVRDGGDVTPTVWIEWETPKGPEDQGPNRNKEK